MWDLGGQPRFEIVGKNIVEHHLLLFLLLIVPIQVILMQRKFNFNKLFNGLVEGVPILVLGNKNDLPNALNENGIIQAMELSNIKDRIVACYSIS